MTPTASSLPGAPVRRPPAPPAAAPAGARARLRRLILLLAPAPIRRPLFWLYAAALFTATHWPKLELPHIVIDRVDLVVHMLAFGGWAALLNLSGYAGSALERATAWRVYPIALAYAGLDEGLQAIPFVHRTCAWDDWCANAAGITLVTIAAWWLSPRSPRS